jgi:hypothetical protein
MPLKLILCGPSHGMFWEEDWSFQARTLGFGTKMKFIFALDLNRDSGNRPAGSSFYSVLQMKRRKAWKTMRLTLEWFLKTPTVKFPRCCAGAAPLYHQGFTDEEILVCCIGARGLHSAYPGHHCFDSL